MPNLYFDNAATTSLHPNALEAMMPYLTENYANPSSVYRPAQKVRKAIDDSREIIANIIGANADEIFFTAGGTEADNWAIKGTIEAVENKGHIITSSIEHHGIFHVCEHLIKQGVNVTYVPVNESGFVSPKDIEHAITKDTCLVSIMLANNEIGTIQPISEISKITKEHNIPFHTDAVQAVGHIPVNVDSLGVDMLSISGHKFHGPKGIGALYVRKGTKLSNLFHGGAQERNKRSGTENVAGIVGMATALELIHEEMASENIRLKKLRDKLVNEILTTIPHTTLNGALENRLPGNANISFRFIEGEALLLHLDMNGCQASTGSACSAISLEPSHVLMAMGLSHELSNGAIRFTLGRDNKESDIDKLLEILRVSVEKIRALSPLYDDFMKQNL